MKIKANNFYKSLGILSLSAILVGCEVVSHNTQSNVSDIPEITQKYSDQEIAEFKNKLSKGTVNQYENIKSRSNALLTTPANLPKSLFYDSGIDISYPAEGVKGVYVTAGIVGDNVAFGNILSLLDNTALNTLVIDFKDDYGNIVSQNTSTNADIKANTANLVDMPTVLKTLESKQIYPIARIVTFKDNALTERHADWSFKSKETGEIWSPNDSSYYSNPFLKEVWDYNVEVAIEAAKMGFKEIQFDYVRFAEAFYSYEESLEYSKETYANYVSEDYQVAGSERVAAITDFLQYAKEKLAPYGVKVSADLFGITAVARGQLDSVGIGQDFTKMAAVVDVISSMIYPDHWWSGNFGLENPFAQPYDLVNEYMFYEREALAGISTVTSRPWLQDWSYGPDEVQAQINALQNHGFHEFLLWNALGEYTSGVDYAPELTSGNTQGNNTIDTQTSQSETDSTDSSWE